MRAFLNGRNILRLIHLIRLIFMEDIKDEEPKFEVKPFEVKPIEGTPLVEVPFTAQKSVREIVSNPWFGHSPSLVLSFRDAHFSFYGNYTEERIRTALRGVFLNA